MNWEFEYFEVKTIHLKITKSKLSKIQPGKYRMKLAIFLGWKFYF